MSAEEFSRTIQALRNEIATTHEYYKNQMAERYSQLASLQDNTEPEMATDNVEGPTADPRLDQIIQAQALTTNSISTLRDTVQTAIKGLGESTDKAHQSIALVADMANAAVHSPTHAPSQSAFPDSHRESFPSFNIELTKFNGTSPYEFDRWKSRLTRILQAKRCLDTPDGFHWALLTLEGSALQWYEFRQAHIIDLPTLFMGLRDRFVPKNEGFRLRTRLDSLTMKGTNFEEYLRIFNDLFPKITNLSDADAQYFFCVDSLSVKAPFPFFSLVPPC